MWLRWAMVTLVDGGGFGRFSPALEKGEEARGTWEARGDLGDEGPRGVRPYPLDEADEAVGVDLTPVATAPREQREKETGG